MDRHGPGPRRLSTPSRLGRATRFAAGLALAGVAVMAAALPAAAPPMIGTLRWTAPDLAAAALTTQPPECLRPEADPAEQRRVEIGRAAFRTPMLLGGQAARLGLSCESCHANGRTNPAFHFPGLSGAPGTADVTNALMSTRRDNAVFDPVPIPDLAAPGKVDRRTGRQDLPAFIRGLIVEEFGGLDPPPAILDGLATYVRHLDRAACGSAAPKGLAESWSDVAVRAVAAARERLDADDVHAAVLLLTAARSALGRLDERYRMMAAHHARLIRLDASLADLQARVEHHEGGIGQRLDGWIAEAPKWISGLSRDEPRSLFNRARLAQAMAAAPARR